MNEYRRLYADVFRLVMAGRGASPEAAKMLRAMDAMPPHGRKGDAQKRAWGEEVGRELYEAALAAGEGKACASSSPA